MERDLRLIVYEKELRRVLIEMRDHDYVIFEDSRDPARYVQYLVHDSAVLGEVGSKHWMPESSGLRKTSVTALGCLGFEGGGPGRNFSRNHLPHDARKHDRASLRGRLRRCGLRHAATGTDAGVARGRSTGAPDGVRRMTWERECT